MAIVIKNTKDVPFSSERPYMVVTFVRNHNSRFAVGSVLNIKYELKYDLRLIYPQFMDVEANRYDAETASNLFKEELPIGSNEDVNLFDLRINDLTNGEHFSVKDNISGVIKDVWHVVCYNNDIEWAKEVAQKDIYEQINERKIEWED